MPRRSFIGIALLSALAELCPIQGAIVEVLAGPITTAANSHAYYLLAESSWTAAEAKAQELGGHLTTVNDPAENDWLLATFGAEHNLWIGLNDAQEDGVFAWTSGQPVTFTNWSPGEPNNAVGGEAYVQLLGAGNGKWNDLPDDFPDVRVNGVVEVQSAAEANCVGSPPGLVGWWPGDGHLNDLAGDNVGVVVNAAFAEGLVDRAFSFTGSNSYVRVPYNPTFAALTNSLTLEAWVFLNRTDRIQKFVTLSPDNVVLQYYGGQFSFAISLGPGNEGGFHDLVATNAIETNRWYHLVAAYDGSNQVLYVDGALAAAATVGPPLTPIGQGSAPEIFISYPTGQTLDGRVDEVAVYNRALSAAEAHSHFAAAAAGMCKQPPSGDCAAPPVGMVGWWPGDGSTMDLTGRDHGGSTNVVFAHGKVGDAFRFIGSKPLGIDSYVLVPIQSAFAALTNVTLECWVWNDPAKPFNRLLTLTPDWAFLAIDDAGHPVFNVRFGDLAATPTGQIFHDVTATAIDALPSASWHHIVGAYNGESVRLYVDGALASGKKASGNMESRGAGVGLFINFFGSEAQGLIDEVAVYNRGLRADEVQAHFAAGAAGMCKQPQFYDIGAFFPGTVRLGLKGPPLKALQIEASPDLSVWSLLSTVTNFTGNARVSDPTAGSIPRRFYRAVVP